MVIELRQKVFCSPRSKSSPNHPNPLRGDSAARCRGDIHGRAQKVYAGNRIAKAQPRERQIGADNAALDSVSRQPQRGGRPVKAVVCATWVAGVEGAQAIESVQAISIEPSVRIVDGQLLDGLPRSTQRSN